MGTSFTWAQVPDHYFNDPKLINPDPNYTPGDYPLQDINDAKTFYQIAKEELITSGDALKGNLAFSLGLGEITYSSIKNETANVLGYFRNYSAVLQKDGKELKKLTISIVSFEFPYSYYLSSTGLLFLRNLRAK